MRFKAGANMETLLRKQKCLQDEKNVLENFKSIFCFQLADFVSSTLLRGGGGGQTRNHLRNTEETLTLNVSRMFPHLRTQATYLEDAEFASQKQNCFTSFDNIVSNIRELKQTDAAAERRRSHSNFLSIKEWMMSRAD